jgi:hypothetical protein
MRWRIYQSTNTLNKFDGIIHNSLSCILAHEEFDTSLHICIVLHLQGLTFEHRIALDCITVLAWFLIFSISAALQSDDLSRSRHKNIIYRDRLFFYGTWDDWCFSGGADQDNLLTPCISGTGIGYNGRVGGDDTNIRS